MIDFSFCTSPAQHFPPLNFFHNVSALGKKLLQFSMATSFGGFLWELYEHELRRTKKRRLKKKLLDSLSQVSQSRFGLLMMIRGLECIVSLPTAPPNTNSFSSAFS
jgi:hypothetical protein